MSQAKPRDDSALAGALLTAAAAGNVASMSSSFTLDARSQLGDKVRAGIVARDLSKLGKLQRLTPLNSAETMTPQPSPAPMLRERFLANYDGGTRVVELTIDNNGLVAAFWIHRPGSF